MATYTKERRDFPRSVHDDIIMTSYQWKVVVQIMDSMVVSCVKGSGISTLRDCIFDVASQVRENTGMKRGGHIPYHNSILMHFCSGWAWYWVWPNLRVSSVNGSACSSFLSATRRHCS